LDQKNNKKIMDIDLKEFYVFLNIHEKSGSITNNNFSYGFAATALIELFLMDKIKLENAKIVVSSYKKIDDPILERIRKAINDAGKTRKVAPWLFRISMKVPKFKKQVLKNLERKRIIKIEYRKFLRLIPYKRYTIKNRQLRKSLINQITEVAYGSSPFNEVLNHYAVVYSSGIIPMVFKSQMRKEAVKRFEEIMEKERANQQLWELTRSLRKIIKRNSREQV